MIPIVVAALLTAWSLGGLLVAALWPRTESLRTDSGLILSLGLIVGLGATSVIFFGASLLSGRPVLLAGVIELSIIAARGGSLAATAGHESTAGTQIAADVVGAVGAGQGLWCSACPSAGSWVARVSHRTVRWVGWLGDLEPAGAAVVRAGAGWPELRRAPVSWTHPDYPKLCRPVSPACGRGVGAEPAWPRRV